MIVDGRPYRTIWLDPANEEVVKIIDQRHLPHNFVVEEITSVEEMARAIKDMHVRGAGLIGAAAAYGMYLATLSIKKKNHIDEGINRAAAKLTSTRPTAVNLKWAVEKQLNSLHGLADLDRLRLVAREVATKIADEDAESCRKIGLHGYPLIRGIYEQKADVVNILTHCNAGWLAFVDHGSATSPIYKAHEMGIPVHVWVDETRPRNQGSRLTAWELGQHGIPHTVIVDNVGGHLMQHKMVDLMITGTDRTTRKGDVANKIGTYLKALAAYDCNVPFYVALPSSSFDWNTPAGDEIPIERRGPEEVKTIQGLLNQKIETVQLTPTESDAVNFAFDVTPAKFVTGLITDRGVCQAEEESILELYPEKRLDCLDL